MLSMASDALLETLLVSNLIWLNKKNKKRIENSFPFFNLSLCLRETNTVKAEVTHFTAQ